MLCLAGTALVVDRVFLFDGPSRANAEDLVIQPDATRTSTTTPVAPEVRTDLAQRLREYGALSDTTPETLNDAFTAPDDWFAMVSVTTGKPDAKPVVVPFVLSAVVNSADGGFAVIDGQPIKVGQSRRGMTLLSIGARTAEIDYAGNKHELRIATPNLDR